jgi:hypothetical protein
LKDNGKYKPEWYETYKQAKKDESGNNDITTAGVEDTELPF